MYQPVPQTVARLLRASNSAQLALRHRHRQWEPSPGCLDDDNKDQTALNGDDGLLAIAGEIDRATRWDAFHYWLFRPYSKIPLTGP
jgi:hypothetical protein